MVAVTTGSQLFHNIFIEFKAQFLTYLQTFISLPSPVKTNNFHFSKSSWSRLSFLLIGWGGGQTQDDTGTEGDIEVEVGGLSKTKGWVGGAVKSLLKDSLDHAEIQPRPACCDLMGGGDATRSVNLRRDDKSSFFNFYSRFMRLSRKIGSLEIQLKHLQ